jgi:hypothetical protein
MAITKGVAGVYQCGGACQTIGACPNTTWGCHDHYCDDNTYLCAWPYFNECSKQNCQLQTDVAWGGGCCYQIDFTNPCNLYGVGCNIVDCGPCDGQFPVSSNVYCYDANHDEVIGCVTASAYKVLCQCNPILKGYVRVDCNITNIYVGCSCCNC